MRLPTWKGAVLQPQIGDILGMQSPAIQMEGHARTNIIANDNLADFSKEVSLS